jgi:hypothetical protein
VGEFVVFVGPNRGTRAVAKIVVGLESELQGQPRHVGGLLA